MSAIRCAILAGFGLILQLSCGTDAPPVCPTGDCTLPGSTVIKWRFNHYPEWQFDSDACSDVGAVTVRVEVVHTADPTAVDMLEKGCGEGQLTFVDLPLGTYDVAVTPLDVDGASLVTAPVTAQVAAGSTGANTEVTVDVPYASWARAYTGQFLFRLSWGGMTCDLATPQVAKQVLTLTAGGQVATQVTDSGQKVDGSDPGPCRPLTDQFPQFVQGLPFGPATLLVVGTAQNNMPLFEKQFDTFVGAGMFNPTITLDVPPPDAGVVDAAIDAI